MSDTPLFIPYFNEQKLWLDYRREIKGDSFTWAFERPTSAVLYLAIHHSVTAIRSTWTGEAGAKKYADEIATIHVDGNGWGGIGYHFIICPDGYLVYVGDVSTARANVKNHNESVIGICMIGDFTKHLPTDQQITSAHEVTTWFDRQRAVWKNLKPTWEEMVQGHKELHAIYGEPATACPGSSWPIDMKDRIKNNIVYTPALPPTEPEPTPEPEPEPEPPTNPDPPDNCCQILAMRIEALERRMAEQENKTIWDFFKKRG